MGEVMIFNIKAHVYILDTNSQSWSPATFSVVPVSFYSEPASGRTRIIAMENSEPKINSLLLPGMVFHRPSDTFGQWMDATSSELYGLNFTSKMDSENFEKAFQDAVAKSDKPKTQVSDKGAQSQSSQSQSQSQSQQSQSQNTAKQGAEEAERLKKEIGEWKAKINEKDAEVSKKVNEAASKGNASQVNLTQKIDALSSQIKTLTAENDHYKTQLANMKSVVSSNEATEAKLRQASNDIEKLKAAIKTNTLNTELWNKQSSTLQKDNAELKAKLQKMIKIQKGFASVLS